MITMAEPTAPSLLQRVGWWLSGNYANKPLRPAGRSARAAGGGDTAAIESSKKAYKCDLCSGVAGGPACVRACPTGAAIRVGPEEFLNITEEVG